MRAVPPSMRRLLLALALLFVAVAAASCKSRAPSTPIGVDSDARLRSDKRGVAHGPTTEAHLLVSVDRAMIGPVVAWGARSDRAGGGLAAYITGPEGSGRRLVVIPLAASVAPTAAKAFAIVANESTHLAVAPLGVRGDSFAIGWTAFVDHGQAVWLAAADAKGLPRRKVVEAFRTENHIVYFRLLATAEGAAAVWVEETAKGEAIALGAALDPSGRLMGVPTRLASGVRAWDAAAVDGGVVLVTATDEASTSKKGEARSATLTMQRFEPDLRERGGPVTLARGARLGDDLEVSADGRGGAVVAWSVLVDREPRIVTAAVARDGALRAPREAVAARGGVRLVALTDGPDPALAWESSKVARRDRVVSDVAIARLAADGSIGERPAVLPTAGEGAVELHRTPRGYAAIAYEIGCADGRPSASGCHVQAPLPHVVRFDHTLQIVQRDVLRVGFDVAAYGWSLACDEAECLVLSSTGDSPSRVRTMAIPARADARRPAVAEEIALPRARDRDALLVGEPVVAVASCGSGEDVAYAVLTNASARSSSATVRIVRGEGADKPIVVTTRALPTGGVGVAREPGGGFVVAWIGRDGGELQVHATRVDAKGSVGRDVLVTNSAGEKHDVALAKVDGGYLVAWADGRGGRFELRAAVVGKELSRPAREQRITRGEGDVADVTLLARGERVLCAFSDSRDALKEGYGDIYAGVLASSDASALEAPRRVLASAAHSRSPVLAPLGARGASLAWIEELPFGGDAPEAGVQGAMVGELDGEARLVGTTARMPSGGPGLVTRVAIDEESGGRRFVLARASSDGIRLVGVDGDSRSTRDLVRLDGPPAMDVALVVRGSALLVGDRGPDARDQRLRHFAVEWPSARPPPRR